MAMRFKDRDKKIVLMTAILFTVTLLLAGSGISAGRRIRIRP